MHFAKLNPEGGTHLFVGVIPHVGVRGYGSLT